MCPLVNAESVRPQDEAELAWWRQSFVCRFGPDNLPHVGDALLGHRFHLFYEGQDGELIRWEARPRRRAHSDGEVGS